MEKIDLNADQEDRYNNEFLKKWSLFAAVALGVVFLVWSLVNWRKAVNENTQLKDKITLLKKAVEGRSFIFSSTLDSLKLISYAIYHFDEEKATWLCKEQERYHKVIRKGSDIVLLDREGNKEKGVFANIKIQDPISGYYEKISLSPTVQDSVIHLTYSKSFAEAYYRYRK